MTDNDDFVGELFNMLESLFGPPPPGVFGLSADDLKAPGALIQAILDSPAATRTTEDILRRTPDYTCCGDPSCDSAARIEKIRAAMIERGDLQPAPPPSPLSQDEAEQLIADYDEKGTS